jgi:uncharacterized membrane protein YhaH (DUF805 family)
MILLVDAKILKQNTLSSLRHMLDSYFSAWSRSFDYEGRSGRSDYWWYVLANLIISFILNLAGMKLDLLATLAFVYSIAQIFPSLSMNVRRLRDIGKHWLWIFLPLIPIIGVIWFIVLMCQPSRSAPSS